MRKLLVLITSMILLISVFPAGSVGAAKERFNMTYLFAASASDPIKYINTTNNSLNQVSPKYFQIEDDGTLDISMPSNFESFIQEMDNRNIEVVPFLANNWAKGAAMFENSEQIAEEISQAVRSYNLDGINIDIEGLTVTYRDEFTAFIKILNNKLPEDKILSVAVAPNPWGTNKGWQGFYDYQALARYVDFLFIMSYDERGGGTKDNGPVASLSFIEKSVQYALKHVPPEKVVLGIPFYGRVWNLEDVNDVQNKNTNRVLGSSISLNKVESLLNTYKVELDYVEEYESVRGSFVVKPEDATFRLKSWEQPLKPGTYEMWLENNESIKTKLELIHKYDLKGVGSWSLGQEDTEIWSDFRLWLDGLDYVDVPIGHWALSSIAYVKEQEWMLGKNTTSTFKPEDSLTRAEAASILVRALQIGYLEEASSPFTDVSTAKWASANIEIVRQHGVMKGTDSDKFEPQKALTREEMAVILERILGGQLNNSSGLKTFTDESEISTWAYPSVVKMAANGLLSGYEEGNFKPQQSISRAEMAALLGRISSYFPK